jgi:N utilization substance protein A
VVGQLLASEGFRSVEEIAFTEDSEIESVEGFDAETAAEIKRRANAFLAKIEAENDARRRELGVADDLRQVPGMTTAMMVALGTNDIKSLEDFAGCTTDDLTGWSERKQGEVTRFPGYLDGFDLSRDEAEAMIMSARVTAGWIEAPAVEPEASEAAQG